MDCVSFHSLLYIPFTDILDRTGISTSLGLQCIITYCMDRRYTFCSVIFQIFQIFH